MSGFENRRRDGRQRRPARLTALAATAVALPLLALGWTTAAGAQSSAPVPVHSPALPAATAARLQQVLDQTQAQDGFPGVIAGVWSPKGHWIGTAGTQGPGQSGAPTAGDLTRIGSLTKTMTATVLLQLAQRKKLSLDDPISKYVPGLPNGKATLRQLADMTSGIPIYSTSDAFQHELFGDPGRAWTPQQLLTFVRNQKPDFAPGKGWEYDNSNYVLLGIVIEKVTKEPIATVFRQRLFGPLGMTHTRFPTTTAFGGPHLSGVTDQGQSSGQVTNSTSWSPSSAFTAGEVVSNFNDLEKWANALFTGKGILKPATEQLRRNSIIHNIPPNTATVGYGIGIGDRDGWWGHDGDIPGYTTVIFHNYSLNTTVIVEVNSDATTPGPSGQEPAPAVFAALAQALG